MQDQCFENSKYSKIFVILFMAPRIQTREADKSGFYFERINQFIVNTFSESFVASWLGV